MFDGIFGNKDDVCREFDVQFDGTVVYAWYEYEGYEGSAEVIFIHDGKFFTVSGGHCSCNGLEGQWDPIEMPLAALKKIAADGKGSYSDGIRNALGVLDELGLMDSPEDVMAVMLKLQSPARESGPGYFGIHRSGARSSITTNDMNAY